MLFNVAPGVTCSYEADSIRPPILIILLATITQSAAAQVTTVCSLYGNTAYCSSNDQSARIAEQQRQQYAAGEAIGRGIGMSIFRAHFPGWRRKYCSTHPTQPYVYSNAAGDSISGNCPSAEALGNEVAAEWLAKNKNYEPTPANGQTMVAYVTEHHLGFFEKKSYDEAYRYLKANGPRKFEPPAPATTIATSQDVFVWFDESAPAPGAPLFEAVVTARAYDEALAILRQARQGNTSVQAGPNVLDTGYHPATISLDAWQKGNPKSEPSLFYWQGEEVIGATQVTHFQMTKRTYEQMMALVAGSGLRVRSSQTSNQNH
jgi:hypothetical protein